MKLDKQIMQELLGSAFVQNLLSNNEVAIDNSDFIALKACMFKGIATAILRRQPTYGIVHLAFGSAVHEGLEHFHAGGSETEAIEKAVTCAIEEGLQNCATDTKNMDSLQEMLNAYFFDYKAIRPDKFKVLEFEGVKLVEQGFALPLGEIQVRDKEVKVYWKGKIDLVSFDEATNKIWVVDHKTTSVMGPQFADDKMRSNQMCGYMWATRNGVGKAIDREVEGVIINALCSRKNGFEFKRFHLPYPKWVTEEWHSEALIGVGHLLEELLTILETGEVSPNRESCCGKYGKCGFFSLCDLMPRMRSSQLFDKSLYQVSTFDPLK